jgi:hypothetical protein
MVSTRGQGEYPTPSKPTNKKPPPSPAGPKVKNKVASPAGRRVKNKVASPVIGKSVAYKHSLPPPSPLHDEEVSSDEFDYKEEEDPSEDEGASVAPSENSSQSSKCKELPLFLQHTLLSDILARGGITQFDSTKQSGQAVQGTL